MYQNMLMYILQAYYFNLLRKSLLIPRNVGNNKRINNKYLIWTTYLHIWIGISKRVTVLKVCKYYQSNDAHGYVYKHETGDI